MSLHPEEGIYEQVPPPVDAVRLRFLTLFAMHYRARMELSNVRGEEEPGDEELATDIGAWAELLQPEIADWERDALSRPFGQWEWPEIVNGLWVQEAAHALAWGLHLVPNLLPVDTRMEWSEESLNELMSLPDPASWRTNAILRDPEQCDFAARVVETWYWRLRVLEKDDSQSTWEYALKLLSRAAKLGDVTLAADGDLLCTNGVSLKDYEEIDSVKSIAMERLKALNWLCGHERTYSRVTSDTIVSWLWDENWPDGQYSG